MKKFILFIVSVALLALASCGDDLETISIEETPQLDLDRTSMSFTKDGGGKDVIITSNQVWEIVIENKEWLTASTLTGEGGATVRFTADPCDAVEGRSNRITVKSATITREVVVTQDASDPRLEVDETDLSYNYKGGTATLQITSNTDWEVVVAEQDNWITTDVAGGTGDGEVTLTVPLYYSTKDRAATIAVKYGDERKEVAVSQTFPVTVGVWVLSEGSAMQPTADLAYYDVANDEMKNKFYSTRNGEPLGQVANFMGLYGDKLYVALSGEPQGSTSSVKVVDPYTGKLIKTIEMKGPHGEGDVARQMAFHDGKVYVTSYFSGGKGDPGSGYSYYGGIARIDTASLSIEAYARVGDKPEGIARHGDKLFVCNNETGNGKTMSIVDIASFKEIKTIPVPENPTYIRAADNGDLYFSTMEIYTGDNKGPSALHKLDPETYEVKTYEGMRASRFAITGKYVYTGDFSYTTFADVVNRLDRSTGAVEPVDLAHPFFMVYSFDANPATGDIYIGGQGDDVIFMSNSGDKLKSFKVGVGFVSQFVPIFE